MKDALRSFWLRLQSSRVGHAKRRELARDMDALGFTDLAAQMRRNDLTARLSRGYHRTCYYPRRLFKTPPPSHLEAYVRLLTTFPLDELETSQPNGRRRWCRGRWTRAEERVRDRFIVERRAEVTGTV